MKHLDDVAILKRLPWDECELPVEPADYASYDLAGLVGEHIDARFDCGKRIAAPGLAAPSTFLIEVNAMLQRHEQVRHLDRLLIEVYQ